MATVVVTLETQSQNFPAGTVAAGIVVSIVGASVAPVHLTAAPYSATFADVPAGSYSANAQAVDANGNPLGAAAVSAQFTIAAPDVAVDVPTVLTVSIQ